MIIVILFVGFTLNGQTTDNLNTMKTNGPGSYKILKNDDGSIKIPFIMHNGKPLMELEINGKKAFLMIDNGVLWDQVWLFGSPLVEELQLKPVGERIVGGAGEGDPTRAYTSDNLTLKFKDIIFFEQPALVSPPAAGFSRMFPGTDGQLCNPISPKLPDWFLEVLTSPNMAVGFSKVYLPIVILLIFPLYSDDFPSAP